MLVIGVFSSWERLLTKSAFEPGEVHLAAQDAPEHDPRGRDAQRREQQDRPVERLAAPSRRPGSRRRPWGRATASMPRSIEPSCLMGSRAASGSAAIGASRGTTRNSNPSLSGTRAAACFVSTARSSRTRSASGSARRRAAAGPRRPARRRGRGRFGGASRDAASCASLSA